MGELIFTSRPLSIHPISWVNGITRNNTGRPVDHVAYLEDGLIYESAAPKGVQCIPYDEWKKGREGTTLIIFDAPENFIYLSVFDQHIQLGTKYDYWANILYLFRAYNQLKKNPTRRMFCSEIIMEAAGFEDSYDWTPARIFDLMVDMECRVKIDFIKKAA